MLGRLKVIWAQKFCELVGTKAQCCYKICYYAMVLLRSPSAWIRDMTHVWKFMFRCNRAEYGTITSGDSSAQTQIRSACERWIIPKEWIGLKLTNFWIFMWWIMSFRVKHIYNIPILLDSRTPQRFVFNSEHSYAKYYQTVIWD